MVVMQAVGMNVWTHYFHLSSESLVFGNIRNKTLHIIA